MKEMKMIEITDMNTFKLDQLLGVETDFTSLTDDELDEIANPLTHGKSFIDADGNMMFLELVEAGLENDKIQTPEVLRARDEINRRYEQKEIDRQAEIERVRAEKEACKCKKCAGTGIVDQYHYYQGGVCFDCMGTGIAHYARY